MNKMLRLNYCDNVVNPDEIDEENNVNGCTMEDMRTELDIEHKQSC